MKKWPAVLAWGAWALAGGLTLLGPAVASGAGTADATAGTRARGAAAGKAGAARAVGAAGAPKAGTVPVSVRQWREVERARLEAGDCIRMQDDTERLACYDELMARRLPPSDPELGERPRGSYGLERSESAVRRGKGMHPPADSLPALPSLDGEASAVSDDEAPAPMWGSAREASRAVQDVRRSLGADLTDRWELDSASDRGRFLLRPYKPMYAMAVDWTSSLNRYPSSPNPFNTVQPGSSVAASLDPGNAKPVEAQFQVSFKSKVAEDLLGNNGDIWLAYTQMSLWQIYSGKLSRPFRETNYEPEVMAVFRTSYQLAGWRMRMASVSLNHQSNGRPQPLSRSWNRIIFQAGLERGRWTLMVRPWWRIREDAKDDDNPDINNYVGRGELVAVYRRGGHEWAGTLRHTLRTGEHARASFNLDYAFPISSYLKAQLQIFHGYGFSLIDYNHRQTRVGLGISLVQWL
ncbi:MAG: phospholipase A [Lautropia sp.]|nr:phospholipase A [Lautropia sp.]